MGERKENFNTDNLKPEFILDGGYVSKFMPGTYEYSYPIIQVKEYLNGIYRKNFSVYRTSFRWETLKDVIRRDIKSGKAKRKVYINNVIGVGNDYQDTFIESDFSDILYLDDDDIPVTDKSKNEDVESIDNAVIYYEDYEVAIVTYTYMRLDMGTFIDSIMMMATSYDNCKEFIRYYKDEVDKIERNNISIVVNGSGGTSRSSKKPDFNVTREDVLIDADIKDQIFRSIDQFFGDGGSFFKENNIPYRRGILLYGPPGNGKTTLIKSIVSTVKTVPIVYWQVSEYTNSDSIISMFESLDDRAPAILVIEDMDSLSSGVRSTFLNCLDGITSGEGIFIIGTTNYPEKIDPALINRVGRFDRTYEIGYPSREFRKSYLENKGIQKFLTEEQIDRVIKGTKGFPMATLNEIYISSALYHYYDGSVDIDKILSDLKELSKKQARNDFTAGHDSIGFAP